MEGKAARIILIPVDGSKNSDRALDWYLSQLHSQGDGVIIINCFEQSSMQAAKHSSVDFNHTYDAWRSRTEESQKKSKALLAKYDEKLAQHKGKLSHRVLHVAGPPGEAIVKHSKSEKATFIIIGSRGMGALRRSILGSVSDYVVHHSNLPVVVVPPS